MALATSSEKSRNVVVVHGRDTVLRDSMFQLLRSLGLAPIEWSEAVRRTGRGAPYTGEVVDVLFQDAQAIVVILSPDERVEIRSDLKGDDSAENNGWQPRPNVFIEAGMAIAKDEPHTILIQIGAIRQASDLFGRNVIRFDGSATQRHELAERLRTAGCAVSTSGSDWLRVGSFGISSEHFKERRNKAK
jgi:predicted nucleotide-binding protein